MSTPSVFTSIIMLRLSNGNQTFSTVALLLPARTLA
jgi:hypothetical protein